MNYKDAITEVKNRINIYDVISEYIKLQRTGSCYKGLCPFHNDKHPSLTVWETTQTYKCFSCGAGGNVYNFIMDIEHLNFNEALKFLANKVGITIDTNYNNYKKDNELREKLFEINNIVELEYYHLLKKEIGKKCLDYFFNRKLTPLTIKTFGLGYSPDIFSYIYKLLKNKGYDDTILDKTGLFTYKDNKVYDKFFNRAMFPILDINNKIIGFGGRILDNGEPKYLNSPDTLIFNKRRNLYACNIAKYTKEKYFILCEGYMDVISLHQSGFTNAVASLGTALTTEQARLIKRYVDKVIISYDSDEAGINAIKRAIPILESENIDTYVLNLKPSKDPDEFITKFGKDELLNRIKTASDSFIFLVKCLENEYNLNDLNEYKRFIEEIVKLLSSIENKLVLENYINNVSTLLKLDKNELKIQVEKLLYTQNKKPIFNTHFEEKTINLMYDVEKKIIQYMSIYPEKISNISTYINESFFQDVDFRFIFNSLTNQKKLTDILDDISSFTINNNNQLDTTKIKNIILDFINDSSENNNTLDEGIEELIKKIMINSIDEKLKNTDNFESLNKLTEEKNKIMSIKINV